MKDYKAQTISTAGVTPRAEIFKAGLEKAKRRSVPGHPLRDGAIMAAGLTAVVVATTLSNGLSGYLERELALTSDPQWTQQVMPNGVPLVEAAALDAKVGPQLFEQTLYRAVVAGTALDAPVYGAANRQTLLQVTLSSPNGNRFAKAQAILKVAAINQVKLNGIAQAISVALSPSLPKDVSEGRADRIRYNANVFVQSAIKLAVKTGWPLDANQPLRPSGPTLLQQAREQKAYAVYHQLELTTRKAAVARPMHP